MEAHPPLQKALRIAIYEDDDEDEDDDEEHDADDNNDDAGTFLRGLGTRM